ncbi:MAG: HU family DNA-binding protein [Bacteroidales bacterium]
MMNKSELISSMAEQTGLSKTDARKALDAFMNCVENALINGDKVSLIGFGTFSIIDKGERKGVNPATKAEILIPAKKAVKFKSGTDLSEKIK